MKPYLFTALILNKPDKSDPDNGLVVIAFRLKERKEKGFNWGTKFVAPREGKMEGCSIEEAALGMAVKTLLLNPIPKEIIDKLVNADIKLINGKWEPWHDLNYGEYPPLIPDMISVE